MITYTNRYIEKERDECGGKERYKEEDRYQKEGDYLLTLITDSIRKKSAPPWPLVAQSGATMSGRTNFVVTKLTNSSLSLSLFLPTLPLTLPLFLSL